MSDKTIRVLQVIGIMNRGGAEAMIMNLYRNIDRTKVQFDFVEHTSEEAAFDQEIISMGGRIFRCPKYTVKNHFLYMSWWKRFFYEHSQKFAIVHGHIGSTAAIYLDIAKKNGLFTIAHSHNTNGTLSVKELMYRVISFPTRYIADYFFGCSVEAGKDRFGKKIAKDNQRYRILKNAIDTGFYKFDIGVRNEVRKEFNVGSELVVGHIGRFEFQKNHTFLIKIFEKILSIDKNAKLILVGDGPLKNEIYQQVKAAGIRKNVIFTGIRSDVNRILQALDVFTMPSLYEGLPVSIVEAQTAGVPCVLSDNVPKDCCITPLVTSLFLKDNMDVWAQHIIERAKIQRKDYSSEIKKNGFDIVETSKWLEEFYLEHSL